VENVQRQDLNAVDTARHLRRLHDEFELTWDQVARAVGKSAVRVKALAGLLELPDDLLENLRQGRLHADTARELARVEDPEQRRILIERAAEGSLPQTQARALVKETLQRSNRIVNGTNTSSDVPESDDAKDSADLRLPLQYADLLLNRLKSLSESDRRNTLLRAKLDEVHAEIHRGL